ncbi:MAG: tetratricopeptide repeat protein [Candidatus Omnitrophica bacterium]|nr:tetratricopeptide repeat protein [Candidatus Omnitrophota bacterium]
MVVRNSLIKHIKHLPAFFKGFATSAPVPKGMCRPLLMLTFAFNYLTCGLNPIGYRIINILFHFLNVAVLFLLLKELLTKVHVKPPNSIFAFIPTLIFLVHPINIESITYISSRSDLMVTLFLLLGITCHIKNKYSLSLLCYAAALLTKETALSFIFFITTYDFIFRKTSIKQWLKNRFSLYAAIASVSALYLIYKNTTFRADYVAPLRSYYSNFLIQARVTFLYLKLFIWPKGLTLFHYIPDYKTIFNLGAFLSVSGLLGIVFIGFKTVKKQPLFSLGIFWFLVGLAPKFYARLRIVAMEHHFYLAGIGIYLIIAFGLSKFYPKLKYKTYFTICVISILSLLTFIRNLEYRDDLIFWKITAQRNPHSANARMGLGVRYMNLEIWSKAKEEIEKAIPLIKDEENAQKAKINLIRVYKEAGENEMAEKLLEETTRQVAKTERPPAGVLQNLGVIYFLAAEDEKALTIWRRALKLYPQSAGIHTNLGNYYLKKSALAKAEKLLDKAIELDPDSLEAVFALGNLYQVSNRSNKAIALYKKALATGHGKKNHLLYYNIGALYLKQDGHKGVEYLAKAIDLKPDFAMAYNDLSVFFASVNPPDWKLAKEFAEKAANFGFKPNEEFLKFLENVDN